MNNSDVRYRMALMSARFGNRLFNIWKDMTLKDKILLALVFGWLIGSIIHEARADERGPFLDLDIGVNIPCDSVKQSSVTNHTYDCGQVANENPVGIVRIGYQFNKYDVWKLNFQPHAYYEHASSIVTNHERGLNVLMVGGRWTLRR